MRISKSEELIAYETGYRWQAAQNLSFDLALFYNDYDELVVARVRRALRRRRSAASSFPIDQREPDQRAFARRGVAGGMAAGRLLAPDRQLLARGSRADVRGPGPEPRRVARRLHAASQVGLRSLLTLGETFEIDAQFRHHTRIRRMPADVTGEGIDAYSELDLRLGWRVTPQWRLSLVGQNLLDDEHVEFGTAESRGALRTRRLSQGRVAPLVSPKAFRHALVSPRSCWCSGVCFARRDGRRVPGQGRVPVQLRPVRRVARAGLRLAQRAVRHRRPRRRPLRRSALDEVVRGESRRRPAAGRQAFQERGRHHATATSCSSAATNPRSYERRWRRCAAAAC